MGAPDNGAAPAGFGTPPSPAPVPTAVGVAPIADRGLVAIIMTTPVGTAWYFVSAEAARAIAANLAAKADEAASGLTIARPGDVPPPPPGL